MRVLLIIAAFLPRLLFAQSGSVLGGNSVNVGNGAGGTVVPVASGGGACSAPTFFNSGTNNGISSAAVSAFVTNAASAGGNNTYITCITWYPKTSTYSAVTNDLGVAGTPICTNIWSSDGSGIEVMFYWNTTAMVYSHVQWSAAPATWRMQQLQFANCRSSSPIGGFVTNQFNSPGTTSHTNTIASDTCSVVASFSSNDTNTGQPVPTWSGATIESLFSSAGDMGSTAAFTAGSATVNVGIAWSLSPIYSSLSSIWIKGAND